MSFEKVIFLGNLKKAKFTTPFKDGENAELSRYRPISVLPFLSKIFEGAMNNCFYKFKYA